MLSDPSCARKCKPINKATSSRFLRWQHQLEKRQLEDQLASRETFQEDLMEAGDENIDIITFDTGQRGTWVPWVGVWNTSPVEGWNSRTLSKRPATTRTTVRPDGTRPPTEFWRFWNRSNVQQFSDLHLTLVATGYRERLINYAGVSMNTDQIYEAAPWTRPGSIASFPLAVENAARQSFLAKLSGVKWDLGVTAGEIRETSDMFVDFGQRFALAVNRTAKSVRKSPRYVLQFLRDMEKRRITTVPRKGSGAYRVSRKTRKDLKLNKTSEKIINDWLLFQFGVKPLLQDIDDATTFLAELITDGSLATFTVRGGFSENTESKGVSLALVVSAYLRQPVFVQTGCHISARFRLRTDPGWLSQLGLNNPASIAWNLLRLTVIVDYFVNIGGWLNSFALRDDAVFEEGTISRIQRLLSFDEVATVVPYKGFRVDRGGATLRFDIGRFERKLLPPEGVRPPSLPQIRKELGLNQVANTLAVLSKLMR